MSTQRTLTPPPGPADESIRERRNEDSYVTMDELFQEYFKCLMRAQQLVAEQALGQTMVAVPPSGKWEEVDGHKRANWPQPGSAAEVTYGQSPAAGSGPRREDGVSFEKGVSMTQDALNTYLEQRTDGVQRSIDVAKAVLGDKENVTVTFRQEPLPLVRAETQKRGHTFHKATEFAEYLKHYGTQDVVVLASAGTGEARAVLNERETTGLEVIHFLPLLDPLWRPWQDLIEQGTVDIREFACFIGKNRATIVEPDGRTVEALYSQLRWSKTTTVDSGRGVNPVNAITIQAGVGSVTGSQVVKLPEQLTVKCPMYYGEEAQQISVDVKVDTSTEHPTIQVKSPDADAKSMEAIAAMLKRMREILPTGATVAVGSMHYEPWEYAGTVAPRLPAPAYGGVVFSSHTGR